MRRDPDALLNRIATTMQQSLVRSPAFQEARRDLAPLRLDPDGRHVFPKLEE
jgi:hypothetical protein